MPMIPVVRNNVIVRLQRGDHRDRKGFLANIEVEETADAGTGVQFLARFLESADQHHLAIHSNDVLIAQFVRLRGGTKRRWHTAYLPLCADSDNPGYWHSTRSPSSSRAKFRGRGRTFRGRSGKRQARRTLRYH